MKPKPKKCKGINRAKGFEGCGQLTTKRIHGLGVDCCYTTWLLNTEAGRDKLNKTKITAKKSVKAKQKKETRLRKEALKTTQDYVRELQVIFNKFIRTRDKDKLCISCQNPLKGKFDAGHFYSTGSYPELRFNENNVHGQCVYCNQHKRGNIHEYRLGLIIRYGDQILEHLERLKNIPRKYTISELKELKESYKQRTKELEN